MAEVIESFLRTEYKYRMNHAQAEEFMKRASDHIVPDIYPQYTVYNIYCDSEDNRMALRCLEHPDYKEKLRFRSYVDPDENTPVFMEVKKKFDGLTGKRRIVLNEASAMAYLNDHVRPGIDSQIARELDFFMKTYRPVAKVSAFYDRRCYASTGEQDVRVTFDENIRYRTENVSIHEDGTEIPLIDDPDTVMLEIKADRRCPMWLTEIISDMKLRRTSFSKYTSIYEKQLKETLGNKRRTPAFEAAYAAGKKEMKSCLIQY